MAYRYSCRLPAVVLLLFATSFSGCKEPEPVIEYTVPTIVPAEFAASKQRMLATMTAHGTDTWFFKVTGPESSIAEIADTFRDFVSQVKFAGGTPDLSSLPDGWKRSSVKRQMRHASILVETDDKQLDISVSRLGLQDDWAQWVALNVNRWRGQLGLEDSDDQWAGAETFEVSGADGPSVWVDIVGEPDESQSMSPPFAGMGNGMGAPTGMPSGQSPPAQQGNFDFDQPKDWRVGKSGGMRLAAFNAGPEDASAEITVIPAGGDIRANVDRWLGQVRNGAVDASVVDEAMQAAKELSVDGRAGQRFLLTDADPNEGLAMDATIVPMDGGQSMFIKMTGPAKTVKEQRDAMTEFLKSLTF